MSALISKYYKYFSITSSSNYWFNEESRYLSPEEILVDNDKHWCSGYNSSSNYIYENQSFRISFPDLPLYVQKYTISVSDSWKYDQFPKSWSVTGKINEQEYYLDYIEESNITRNNTYFTSQFKVHGPITELNFTMIGPNYKGDSHFCVKQIRLYGYAVNFLTYTGCPSISNNVHSFLFFVAIML